MPPSRVAAISACAALVLTGCSLGDGGRSDDPGPGRTRIVLQGSATSGSAPDDAAVEQSAVILGDRLSRLGIDASDVRRTGAKLAFDVPEGDRDAARSVTGVGELRVRVVNSLAFSPDLGSVTTGGSTPAPLEVTNAQLDRQSFNSSTADHEMNYLDCSAADPLRGRDEPSRPLVTCAADASTRFSLGPAERISPVGADAGSDTRAVGIRLDDDGADAWRRFASANPGRMVAFVLDTAVVSAPILDLSVQSGPTITLVGLRGDVSAAAIVAMLTTGSLPAIFVATDA